MVKFHEKHYVKTRVLSWFYAFHHAIFPLNCTREYTSRLDRLSTNKRKSLEVSKTKYKNVVIGGKDGCEVGGEGSGEGSGKGGCDGGEKDVTNVIIDPERRLCLND